ncbi:hypothetical protein SS1G_06653 [Sclerotinia sclerotiorum 1980 UF-70]|uniref:Glycoside hydrolase family 65 N-terminal domain-containing protein n=1 Tax=Sclerotinia sclerotiorum (strain ATCC 18683 / 1980 / Ss-1) TaxID=665079 RepID=A7EMV4_SCLS1|nr:hypothetical protein SS1G_06653 [Sclerotinia sclerotiorum 1980 UF-70]EDO04170.1 hypothetical protein SS1G_06653 [Sclerotinia sclerotiorum 1980 UF-70]
MAACMSWLPHLAVVTPLPAVAFGADYGEEVNPASQFKTKTIPDGIMPPLPDFGVLAENPLSRWDDQNLTLTTNVPILGNFLARMHLSNGAARINVAAIQLSVTPLNGTAESITITDSLDGRSAVKSFLGQKGNDASSIYVSNHPNGLQNVSAWTVSTAKFSSSNTKSISPRSIVYPSDDTLTIGKEWEFELKSGQPITFHKFVGIASTDKFSNAQLIASQASRNATNDGWDVLLAEHTAIWNQRMERKVVDYRNPATGNLPINDTLAEVDQINAAEKYKFDNDSVLYSWTSGRYGNATETGPTLDYEYHINTDVAKMMLDYRGITNNEEYFKEELWPVVESVGHTIEGVLQKDDQGKWNIWDMTDPDGWTNHVKNGALTQASFFQIMNSIISIKK